MTMLMLMMKAMTPGTFRYHQSALCLCWFLGLKQPSHPTFPLFYSQLCSHFCYKACLPRTLSAP